MNKTAFKETQYRNAVITQVSHTNVSRKVVEGWIPIQPPGPPGPTRRIYPSSRK